MYINIYIKNDSNLMETKDGFPLIKSFRWNKILQQEQKKVEISSTGK